MSAALYIPFFYFQQTRLNNAKAVVFHFVYEWLPAYLIVSYESGSLNGIVSLLLYYLAFISLYEIGYLINDQSAHKEKEGRKRTEQFTSLSLISLIGIRVIVFALLTFYLNQQHNYTWWIWYGLLAVIFALHNVISLSSLKVMTFCYLAFARFFSPVLFLLPVSFSLSLFFPVFLNYVLFRMFTYIDSKNMLQNFERKAGIYRSGFYLLIAPFSIVLSYTQQSWIPIGVNLYYLIASTFFAIAMALQKDN